MLSKNKIKYLTSLSEKKSRTESMTFLVEGEKMILELMSSNFKVLTLLYTNKMISAVNSAIIPVHLEKIEITENESLKISSQKTPQGIFAIVAIPPNFYSEYFSFPDSLIVALQDIQDPGNLGTIIRTADWFGIKYVLCSKSTADVLNPKVLQSTMGAVFRVKVIYTNLIETIKKYKNENPDAPVLAAVLEGENIYKFKSPKNGLLMMGNESKGLSPELTQLATHRLTIPNFGQNGNASESLNVSIATAVILSELKRQLILA